MQTEVANHVCPSQHVLYEFSTPNSEWACDTCRSEIAQGAIMYGCRECDWDICIECLSKQVKLPEAVQEALPKKEPSLASDILRLKQSKLAGWLTEEEFTVELKKLLASQGKPTTPRDGVQVTQQTGGVKQEPTKTEPRQEILSNFGCLKKHELKMFNAPDDQWRCNLCNQIVQVGTVMLGCRACDWDGCHACYDKDREENAQLVKGSPCWYKKPDGSLVQAVIESVDQAHSPPSYIVVVEGSARETERERLLAFLPLAKSVELQQEQEKLRAEATSKVGAEAPEPSS
mmetsp:Transcript_2125/g.6486  ORF Transcript_2125/g.6486 Transcript_2125/m.6486 type:complete len:288 (+) Transcript_2125:1-864(+)